MSCNGNSTERRTVASAVQLHLRFAIKADRVQCQMQSLGSLSAHSNAAKSMRCWIGAALHQSVEALIAGMNRASSVGRAATSIEKRHDEHASHVKTH